MAVARPRSVVDADGGAAPASPVGAPGALEVAVSLRGQGRLRLGQPAGQAELPTSRPVEVVEAVAPATLPLQQAPLATRPVLGARDASLGA